MPLASSCHPIRLPPACTAPGAGLTPHLPGINDLQRLENTQRKPMFILQCPVSLPLHQANALISLLGSLLGHLGPSSCALPSSCSPGGARILTIDESCAEGPSCDLSSQMSQSQSWDSLCSISPALSVSPFPFPGLCRE